GVHAARRLARTARVRRTGRSDRRGARSAPRAGGRGGRHPGSSHPRRRPPRVAAVRPFSTIRYEKRGPVAIVTLDRPEVLKADDARFALPETGLGMIPGVGGTQTLPRRAGLGRALDLVLTGRRLDARDALAAGIVHRVVARRRLDGAALALARDLATRDPALV